MTIRDEPALTEEAYAEDRKRGPAQGCSRSPTADGTPVICTQGKVIPDLIAWWCDRDGVRPDKSRNRKGSTWVLSLAGGATGGRRPHRQPAGRQRRAITAHRPAVDQLDRRRTRDRT